MKTLDIAEWCKDHSGKDENLFVEKLREHFTDDQIVIILTILDNICKHCYDAQTGCLCWNDPF